MSKAIFDDISGSLQEAIEIVHGEADPSTYRVQLIESAEERTIGYLRAWIDKNAGFKAALHRNKKELA